MTERKSYRDYLIWTASHTASALNNAIRTAIDMDDEEYAIQHLEKVLDVVGSLATYKNPNSAVVQERAEVVPTCPQCGRDLHGYRGPLCRYCDGTAE